MISRFCESLPEITHKAVISDNAALALPWCRWQFAIVMPYRCFIAMSREVLNLSGLKSRVVNGLNCCRFQAVWCVSCACNAFSPSSLWKPPWEFLFYLMLQASINRAFFVIFEIEGIYPKLAMEFKTPRYKMYRDNVPHCKSIDWRRISTIHVSRNFL